MVPSDDFGLLITHRFAEIVVRLQNFPGQIEFDDGLRTVQGVKYRRCIQTEFGKVRHAFKTPKLTAAQTHCTSE